MLFIFGMFKFVMINLGEVFVNVFSVDGLFGDLIILYLVCFSNIFIFISIVVELLIKWIVVIIFFYMYCIKFEYNCW